MEIHMTNLKEKDAKYVAGTYARFPVEIKNGKGSILYDTDGKRYIDMGSGIGVTAFGIADDEWVSAVTSQLSRVQHTSNLYFTDPCAELAELLCEKTGMRKVFFGNSGAEANECAIKVARKWGEENLGADHYTIVTMKNSFHGRTVTTLAATGQDHYHEHFGPMTEGFVHADIEDLDGVEKLIVEHKACAVIFECIQGEGGVIPLSADFVRGLDALAKKHGILLVVDEVQTGNGRTGEFYAYMNYGITPDVVSTAKGLGGGLPIGACLLGERVCDTLKPGDHGSTYGGNPVCCAGAVSVISRLDEVFLASVKAKSRLVFDTLEGKEGIEGVTGAGLMIGIKTTRPAKDVVAECMAKGVLCLTAKDKVRLLPALNIPEDVLLEALGVILEAAKAQIPS